MTEQADAFIAKGTDASGVTQAYQLSRSALIDAMWENIEATPFQGIGFGLPSSPHLLNVKRDSVLGLPVSAVVEKGVLPVAVLEELGVFGFGAVVLWLLPVVIKSARHGVGPLAIVIAVLLLNMGEAFFFSTGGMGLFSTILIAWGTTSPRRMVETEA